METQEQRIKKLEEKISKLEKSLEKFGPELGMWEGHINMLKEFLIEIFTLLNNRGDSPKNLIKKYELRLNVLRANGTVNLPLATRGWIAATTALLRELRKLKAS